MLLIFSMSFSTRILFLLHLMWLRRYLDTKVVYMSRIMRTGGASVGEI